MNRLFIVISTIVLTSCAGRTVKEYEQLIDRADRIVINKQEQHDSIVISTPPQLQNIKEVLKRNIKPEPPRKFTVERTIAIYANDKRLGLLMVSYGDNSYVNFRSDSLNFTFPLTYGIGMSLSELTSENSR
jgi:hypothetical protein